jgi:hypothetical protein
MNPLHTLPSYFLKMHFNIILLFTTRASNYSLLFRLLKDETSLTVEVIG